MPISHSQDTAGPMAASVREAAELLTAIAGSDPADAATRDADRHKRDYAAGLDGNSLKGKRIGVLRFASTPTLDPAFDTALAILREKGAVLVDIKKFDDKLIGKNEGSSSMPSSRPIWPNISRAARRRSAFGRLPT